MTVDISQVTERIKEESAFVSALTEEIEKVIVGQRYMVERLLIGILTRGHCLLEGVPGLAKTLTVTTLAKCVHADFKRLQFTPDLLPADLTGTLIFNQKTGDFHPQIGPIFANIVLADEINRAPAKVQSALLEAMQERQVTIGQETFVLEDPFLVMATQNPIEQEGTYPLPEAQVDRFMLKVVVKYPTKQQERIILDRMSSTHAATRINPVLQPEAILAARRVVDAIYMDDKIKDYIVDLVSATRDPAAYKLPFVDLIQYGASPRATISLTLASKASAFLAGRGYVTPYDVKNIATDVFRHRVIVTYEAEAEEKTSEDIIQAILDHVPVP
jgi:MoxR-like ATPase